MILADYRLATFSAARALEIARARDPELPFIFVSAPLTEDVAVDTLRSGATDYVPEGGLARLGSAVLRALAETGGRADRKRLEEEVRAYQQRVASIMEEVPAGFLTVDLDLRITYVNTAGRRIWDKTEDEVLGKTIWDVFPDILGTDFHRAAMEFVASGQPTATFESFSEPTGRWIEIHAYPTEQGYAAFFLDVTERRRAEQEREAAEARYRTLVEQIPAVTYLDNAFDESGGLLYVSPQIKAMLGYTVDEWLSDPDLWERIVHPDDRERVDREDERARQRWVAYEDESRLIARDGRTVWVHDRSVPVSGPDGLRLMHGVMFDITKRVQAEEEIENIHDDSIQVMTAVGMRLAVLRHELGVSEHVETVQKLEETVQQSIERLRHLLFELRPAALDREGLTAALREYLDMMLEQGGPVVTLNNELDLEPGPETSVLLYRLAQEALTNVRKHSKAGHAEISLERRDAGVLVRVRDDGVGFDLDRTGWTVPGHLGIASMRERAELSAGWVNIDTKPGEGTTVEFWVPDVPDVPPRIPD